MLSIYLTGPERLDEFVRTVQRLKDKHMGNFHLTDADFATMTQIARVTSRESGAARWTELAIYHRPGANRPFVAVTEGHSVVAGETLRRQYAAMGTLDRAMNWFDGSALRDRLAAAVDAWQRRAGTGPTRVGSAPAARPAFATLTEALAWLYPGDLSERNRALALERDFGMPERTTRATLAIEAGRANGNVGAWVPMLLAALRYFDREAWEAGRG